MNNSANNKQQPFLVLSFVWVMLGLALCVNYFFVPGIKTAELIGNISTILAFFSTIWYMVWGYKNNSDLNFGIPLFMYSACVVVTISSMSVLLPETLPILVASMCVTITYPIIIAFNQSKRKLCMILFLIIIISEVAHSGIIFIMYGPKGVFNNGDIVATLHNIHIFVRTFMTSALALCYRAKSLRK